MSNPRVLITGASGLLGRAILNAFKNLQWEVLGTAFSRSGGNLVQVDICDFEKTAQVVRTFSPSFIIHCAAQRFPDKVDKDVDATIKLNVEATKNLADLAVELGATMIYISTDYVFDGTKPPYSETDLPNPLNTYGRTKLLGEEATLKSSKDHIVLRIPVLYGPVNYIGESAVTFLLELLLDSKAKLVSNTEIRYPSHVDDIASVCVDLLKLKSKNVDIRGIYHFGGKESLSKYQMVQTISSIFDLSMDHITPDSSPSQGALRPQNAQLNNRKIEELGIGKHTLFRDGIRSVLEHWVEQHKSGGTLRF